MKEQLPTSFAIATTPVCVSGDGPADEDLSASPAVARPSPSSVATNSARSVAGAAASVGAWRGRARHQPASTAQMALRGADTAHT